MVAKIEGGSLIWGSDGGARVRLVGRGPVGQHQTPREARLLEIVKDVCLKVDVPAVNPFGADVGFVDNCRGCVPGVECRVQRGAVVHVAWIDCEDRDSTHLFHLFTTMKPRSTLMLSGCVTLVPSLLIYLT